MPTRQLEPSEWGGYFDRFSKHLAAKLVEVSTLDLDRGEQTEAQWMPLRGMSYDPKGRDFEVSVAELAHRIHAPEKIYVAEGAEGIENILVVEPGGRECLIKLRTPVVLDGS